MRNPVCHFGFSQNVHYWREPLNNAIYAEKEIKVRETVTNFMLSSINISNLNQDDNLFESGVVNSLFAVQLVTFLEKTFALEIGMDDLDIENFKSLNATTAFVMRKNGGQRAGATP
jgi:methoxymalonate biosynthesis acyl carrier protein